MQTIQKILWYPPLWEYQISLLEKAGLYNGTGTDDINFDTMIDAVLDLLKQAKIFDERKKMKLRRDIIQLVVLHDIETGFRLGFARANRRLAIAVYKLLHAFPYKYRIGVALAVYKIVSSNVAKKNYFNK